MPAWESYGGDFTLPSHCGVFYDNDLIEIESRFGSLSTENMFRNLRLYLLDK